MIDEILAEFVNESLDHLSSIEEDLLTLEESGDGGDDEIVNKIFRAAHSIKGGSSFFGLNNVKNLAHKAEAILDLVRARKMTPDAEIISILLTAFDKLRDMLRNTQTSEQEDIGGLLDKLAAVVSSGQAPADKTQKQKQEKAPEAVHPGPPRDEIDRARRCGQYIYEIVCDLVQDVEKKGKTLKSFFDDLMLTGEILDCATNADAVGTLDNLRGDLGPLRLLFATIQEPDLIRVLLDGVPPDRIQTILDPNEKAPPGEAAPEPKAAPPPESAETPPPEPAAPPPGAPALSMPATLSELKEKASPPESAEKPPEQSEGPPQDASPDKLSPASPSRVASQPGETLRVNVDLMENLANLAGELVLSRNQLRMAVSRKDEKLLSAADHRINQIVSELQNAVMQTRLQPIGNVFSRFPRVVRDHARTMGKEVQLEILGKDITLDKSMVEGLADSLTHMVRNSVAHGIETVEERRSAGKKAEGLIRIEARREAGKVVVDIADDGAGIDPERVSETAIRKGLISADKVKKLSDAEKQALIFLPGLSTNKEVSEIAGRGVGMDVVKTFLDQISGQVEIHSVLGKGTLFRIKLPPTLAVVPSLIVTVCNERFVIPQANVEELLRMRPEEVKECIGVVGDSEVLLLRDRILPLTRLADILGIEPRYVDPATDRMERDRRVRLSDRRSRWTQDADPVDPFSGESERPHTRRGRERRQSPNSALELVVATTGLMSYGLVVDAFLDTEEVMVKPLGRRLRSLREYSGSTILGDGAVALILDVVGLAAKAGLSHVSDSFRAAESDEEETEKKFRDSTALLLFHNGPNEPMAVPLNLVQRVESVQPGQIEDFGDRRTIKYRNSFLPVYSVFDHADMRRLHNEMNMILMVCCVDGVDLGLLGFMPVDAIHTHAEIDSAAHVRKGIAGSLILRNRTTLLVNLHDLAAASRGLGLSAPIKGKA